MNDSNANDCAAKFNLKKYEYLGEQSSMINVPIGLVWLSYFIASMSVLRRRIKFKNQ